MAECLGPRVNQDVITSTGDDTMARLYHKMMRADGTIQATVNNNYYELSCMALYVSSLPSPSLLRTCMDMVHARAWVNAMPGRISISL